MSTTNHLHTDGQTERVNQCIETYLRCFVQACPKWWSFWVPLAQFWYNSSHHSAIGMTPFKAMFGREPRHWGIEVASACKVPALKHWLEERKTMQMVLKQHLHRARHIMKIQADNKTVCAVFGALQSQPQARLQILQTIQDTAQD